MLRSITLMLILAAAVTLVPACGDGDLDSATDSLKKSAGELGDKAGGLLDEGKTKMVDGLKDQIAKLDVEGLKSRFANADASTKAKIGDLVKSLDGKKDAAMDAIKKLAGGEGAWDDLLSKAKNAVTDLKGVVDKIKAALGG